MRSEANCSRPEAIQDGHSSRLAGTDRTGEVDVLQVAGTVVQPLMLDRTVDDLFFGHDIHTAQNIVGPDTDPDDALGIERLNKVLRFMVR